MPGSSRKFYGKYDIPFIETSNLFVLWRGAYDSIYDTTPTSSRRRTSRRVYQGLGYFDYRPRRSHPRRRLELDGSHTKSGTPTSSRTRCAAYVDLKLRGR